MNSIAPIEQLELSTALNVPPAAWGERGLENLIDTLMRTAAEQTGAERGVLMLIRGNRFTIESEATRGGNTISVRQREASVAATPLPLSIIDYVLRTREALLLEDASLEKPFLTDPYVRARKSQSILCVPLGNQARLVAVLFLENNLTPRVFTPAATLKALAPLAAIALEQALLDADRRQTEQALRESEEQWRAAFDSNPRMPGMSGLALHDHLVAIGTPIQTVLMTAYPEERARERALKAGTFGAVLLNLQAVWDLFSTRPAQARQILESAIEQTARAIAEGRETVKGLRTSTEEPYDLAAAIGALGEELATDSAAGRTASFRVYVEGAVRPLHPAIRDEIYRIAGEALRNAFQHSLGSQLEVDLRYDKRQVRLRVRDDGKGIDPKVLAEGGREGHYGLRGMRERAELVGGKLSTWSGPGGTEDELIIPAQRAYATARDTEWLFG